MRNLLAGLHVTEWRDVVRQYELSKSRLTGIGFSKFNILDRAGRLARVTEPVLGPWGLFGNVAIWCVPDSLNQADLEEVGTGSLSFGVGGRAWNKGPTDTDDDWVCYRWVRTGAVGVGYRCVHYVAK